MTKITCDTCGGTIDGKPIKVLVNGGESDHNGDTMRRTIDVCADCASNINGLTASTELDGLVRCCKANAAKSVVEKAPIYNF